MSRKSKKKKSSSEQTIAIIDDYAPTYFPDIIGIILIHLASCVTQLLSFISVKSSVVIRYLRSLLLAIVIMVSTGVSGSSGSGQKLSAKKEAKLRNKQNKLMAEYDLVMGRHDEDEGPSGGKKMKLENGAEKKKLSEEEFKKLKLELAERKRNLTNLPRFKANQLSGLQASIFLTEYATRTPLLLSDIQHLVTYAFGGNEMVPPPSRWCQFQKPNRLMHVVLLVVNGVGLNEFVDNEDKFSRTMGIFGGDSEENRGIFEVLDPIWYGDSVFGEVHEWGLLALGRNVSDAQSSNGCTTANEINVEAGANSTDISDQKEKIETEDGRSNANSLLIPQQNFSAILNQLRSVFPILKQGKDDATNQELPESDKFPRTALLLTLPSLISESYPLPIPANTLTRNVDTGYTLTSESYAPVTPSSKMFSIDCEMGEAEGDPNALIRVAVVNEELETVYESVVKPKGKILDYRTRWSGVTPAMMEGVKVRLKDVQAMLRSITEDNPGCIFIGQSFNCDLKSLRVLHPYIIDTSTIFNLSGVAGRKTSLKDLSLNLLDEIIQNKESKNKQNQQQGHCPVEDARAAMKLVKAKLANGFSFGNILKSSNENGENSSAGEIASNTATLVSVEEPIVKSQLTSCKNKLTKDVLIVTQKDDADVFPFCNECSTNSTSPLASSTVSSSKSKFTTKSTTTNGNVIKLMHGNFLESFLTVGFYKVNEDSDDFAKTLGKLDKRIEKLYNRMCLNSLLVVVGCGGKESSATEKDKDSKTGRRNNGVGLIRVKVNEGMRKRRDD